MNRSRPHVAILLGVLAACGSEPEQLTPASTQPAAGPARVKLTYYNVDG